MAAFSYYAAMAMQAALYPIGLVLGWLMVALSPIWHLLRLLLYTLRIHLRFIATLQPLYVYLGCAVVVGIVVGAVMYLISSALITALHLCPAADEDGSSTTVSISKSKERREGLVGRSRHPPSAPRSLLYDGRRRRYGERQDQIRAPAKGGLLSQIILEEEDDSDAIS